MSDYAEQLLHLANSERLLNFPDGWTTSVDPVEGNPFRSDDKRRRVWADATRYAEEELCQFRSDYLKLHSSAYNKHRSAAEAEKAVADRTCVLAVGKFDIWARRGSKVVWTDSGVLDFDKWLDHYAEACLKEIRGWFPTSIPVDWVLREVRPKLARQCQWWKAEAHRYLAEHKADLAEENASSSKRVSRRPSKKPSFYARNESYQTIEFREHEYSLTPQAGAIVKVLHEAGGKPVAKAEIQSKTKCGKISDSFRSFDGRKVWKELIVVTRGRKGFYTLDPRAFKRSQ
jgi:hypothetical protein